MNLLRLLTGVIVALALSFVAATLVDAQAPTLKKCDHTSDSFERFEGHMRITVPVKVTYFDGAIIEGVAESKTDKVIKPVKFYIDSNSNIPKEFRSDYKKGKWWMIYCDLDNYVYVAAAQLPSQIIK